MNFDETKYRLVSSNPLVWYVVAKLEYTNKVINYENSAYVTFNEPYEISDNITLYLDGLCKTAYAIPIHEDPNYGSEVTVPLTNEISALFDIEILGRDSNYLYVNGKSKEWLLSSMYAILNGTLPLTNILSSEFFLFQRKQALKYEVIDRSLQVERPISHDNKIIYSAVVAYYEIVVPQFPYLASMIPFISLRPDKYLSVPLPLERGKSKRTETESLMGKIEPTPFEIKDERSGFLNEYKERVLSEFNQCTLRWTNEIIADYEEGLRKIETNSGGLLIQVDDHLHYMNNYNNYVQYRYSESDLENPIRRMGLFKSYEESDPISNLQVVIPTQARISSRSIESVNEEPKSQFLDVSQSMVFSMNVKEVEELNEPIEIRKDENEVESELNSAFSLWGRVYLDVTGNLSISTVV